MRRRSTDTGKPARHHAQTTRGFLRDETHTLAIVLAKKINVFPYSVYASNAIIHVVSCTSHDPRTTCYRVRFHPKIRPPEHFVICRPVRDQHTRCDAAGPTDVETLTSRCAHARIRFSARVPSSREFRMRTTYFSPAQRRRRFFTRSRGRVASRTPLPRRYRAPAADHTRGIRGNKVLKLSTRSTPVVSSGRLFSGKRRPYG